MGSANVSWITGTSAWKSCLARSSCCARNARYMATNRSGRICAAAAIMPAPPMQITDRDCRSSPASTFILPSAISAMVFSSAPPQSLIAAMFGCAASTSRVAVSSVAPVR
ncbi:hypothetical protein D9M69_580690 [compost metagenome]